MRTDRPTCQRCRRTGLLARVARFAGTYADQLLDEALFCLRCTVAIVAVSVLATLIGVILL